MSKVNTFVDIYCSVLNLENKTTNIIKELSYNWIEYYSKIKPIISVEEDSDELFIIKPKDGYYSIEDYFLNKLMRNILHFKYDYSSADTFMASKGEFSPSEHRVEINEDLIKDSINSVMERIMQITGQQPIENLHDIIYKKVIMHEFEHGLKVSYDDGKLNPNDIEIIKTICYKLLQTEYGNICKTPDELETINNSRNVSERWTHNGMEHKDKKVYAIRFLDEINNENESLIMAKTPLQYNDGTPDMYYINRNSESSSSFYASTIEMFNIIFGRNNVFSLTYLNKSDAIDLFNNKYDKIFQKEFSSNEPAMNIFCYKLNECKRLMDKLKLEETLLKCFYSELGIRCEYDLESTLSDWNAIKKATLQFSDEIMQGFQDSTKTAFFRIYNEIEQYLFVEKVSKFNNTDETNSSKKSRI